MSWWRRLVSKNTPIYDEEGLRAAAGATDEGKESWHRARMDRMRSQLPADELAAIDGASDEENEAALGEIERRYGV